MTACGRTAASIERHGSAHLRPFVWRLVCSRQQRLPVQYSAVQPLTSPPLPCVTAASALFHSPSLHHRPGPHVRSALHRPRARCRRRHHFLSQSVRRPALPSRQHQPARLQAVVVAARRAAGVAQHRHVPAARRGAQCGRRAAVRGGCWVSHGEHSRHGQQARRQAGSRVVPQPRQHGVRRHLRHARGAHAHTRHVPQRRLVRHDARAQQVWLHGHGCECGRQAVEAAGG